MGPVAGALLAALGGLCIGSGSWTLKEMRRYRFEHWLLVGMSVGLVILPWSIMLGVYPDALAAIGRIPRGNLLLSNLFSMGWGVANVLCALCFVRIGVALTGGILGGLGMAMGVLVPMLFRGSGLFSRAPGPGSPAGLAALGAVGLLVAGAGLCLAAGLLRERPAGAGGERSPGFRAGLALAALAGVLSSFPNFAFAYGQDAIIAAIHRGAPGSDPLSTVPVWAVGMMGGALVNLAYAALLVHRGRGWRLLAAPRDLGIAMVGGSLFIVAFGLMGQGALLMGPLGASAGWGIYQVGQILGGQAVGLAYGEWRGADPKACRLMAGGVTVLIAAAGLLAWANSLAR